MLSYEELQSLARGAIELVEASTPAPVTVIVVVANAQPHRGELARYSAEWNLGRVTDVARVCREVAAAAEAS